MIGSTDQNVVFFGCPLDPDEKHDAIEEKLAEPWRDKRIDDPLAAVVNLLAVGPVSGRWTMEGSVAVPGWLRPIPAPEDRAAVVVDRMVDFIDRGGCREFADRIREFVTSKILPAFPCLIAVDHSLTGGAYEAVSQHYGPENVSLVVIDSHTDAVPMSKLAAAIAYDAETNPNSVYDRNDPFLYNRSESYNASSFLHHLATGGVIDPRNLYVLGVSDSPGKKAFRIKDPRIADYVSIYTDLRRRGATVVTKKDLQLKPKKVKSLLNKIRTPYAYVSVDMDIGARNALEGVRFRNWQGLNEKQIYRLADLVAQAGGDRVRLVGMDITEINPRVAGRPMGTATDRTYPIAANLIRRLAFDLDPVDD